ncbi:hypothetical protein LCGC14_1898850 [marine sediment metagenome]|uniref:Uncharacterized protein n=1 Tax=marine sediment metagenome TaxID=412755 RepID=A0A0F9GKK4_9ZZZZ
MFSSLTLTDKHDIVPAQSASLTSHPQWGGLLPSRVAPLPFCLTWIGNYGSFFMRYSSVKAWAKRAGSEIAAYLCSHPKRTEEDTENFAQIILDAYEPGPEKSALCALQRMTPGGSGYDTVDKCVAYINDYHRRLHDQIKALRYRHYPSYPNLPPHLRRPRA